MPCSRGSIVNFEYVTADWVVAVNVSCMLLLFLLEVYAQSDFLK